MSVAIDDDQPINVTMSGDSDAFSPGFSGGVIQGGGNIDDDHILPTSTWSSQKINTELNKKANSIAVAPDYTAGSSYVIGDLCTYHGDLLRCTAAIVSAAATPDSGSWDVIDLLQWVATTAQVQAIITGYTA